MIEIVANLRVGPALCMKFNDQAVASHWMDVIAEGCDGASQAVRILDETGVTFLFHTSDVMSATMATV